ncbi:MAG: serine/threonine-protein kinase [Bacteroides sp.]|nr:serine/threonine-protein kinase [Bacteroides sp.]
MEENNSSSGFVKTRPDTHQDFTEMQEIYISASGYNRLFRCERYGRLHVFKTLKDVYAGSNFHEQALQKEFAIGYQLEHPHICRTQGWEEIPGLGNGILLEYIDGITLRDFMDRGLLTRQLAYKFIAELCAALQYLHSKQIVHRDIKPGNIMITHNGNNVKLIDFSLSDHDDYDILKMPAGTRYYLAPEALQPGVTPDLRADIYSLGLVMGEMATILKDKHIAAISRKCTQRKPERRYATASDVAAALTQHQLPIGRSGIAALLLALVIGGAVACYWMWGKKTVGVTPFPVYGNITVPDACRRILSDEQISIHDSKGNAQTDSIALLQRLKEALDAAYPLAEQRNSDTYRKQWTWLMEEAEKVSANPKSH